MTDNDINRQKAENEKLTVNKNAYGLAMQQLSEQLETAKSEAIKEFAEQVKALFIPEDDVRAEIDNLVKEMTEVSE